jgi:hypothetical protein
MNSARKPSFNTPASSRIVPVSTTSVATARTASVASCGDTDSMATAVSAAMVDVVLTDKAREVPSSEYTSKGTSAV